MALLNCQQVSCHLLALSTLAQAVRGCVFCVCEMVFGRCSVVLEGELRELVDVLHIMFVNIFLPIVVRFHTVAHSSTVV